MEASALRHAARRPVLAGFSPHLRLQSDDRLVALVRRGHDGAFEALVRRYQPRLLAFCRHMLGSLEDAEDALQEVLASAYTAIRADERSIAVRPWLYRIARNRCLNHLRRPRAAPAEALDEADPRRPEPPAADTVHRREELRALVGDIRELPETQRTALLLKQVDALSYEQIAGVMQTSVPSVKSLLVRARVSLAEASEARLLTCAEVRLELGQAAEGIARASSAARRHARECSRCRVFKRELRRTSRGLVAVLPAGPLLSIQQLLAGKLGGGSAAAGGSSLGGSAAAGGSGLAGAGGAALSTGMASVATKAAAGLLAAGAVTVGAVEARNGSEPPPATALTEQPSPTGGHRAHRGTRGRGAGAERRRHPGARGSGRDRPARGVAGRHGNEVGAVAAQQTRASPPAAAVQPGGSLEEASPGAAAHGDGPADAATTPGASADPSGQPSDGAAEPLPAADPGGGEGNEGSPTGGQGSSANEPPDESADTS